MRAERPEARPPRHRPRPFLAGLLALLLLALAAGLFLCLCAGAPAPAEVAVPLCVHLAGDEPEPLRAYLDAAVPRAQALLGPAGARFEVRAVALREPAASSVQSAAERDALAALAPRDGCLHVFLVPRLGDLARADKPIAGRHWRYQGKRRELRGRRYVIVAPGSARLDTLAHELGHYFGLGHRPEASNLMKQLPRDEAPALTPGQLGVVRKALATFRPRNGK